MLNNTGVWSASSVVTREQAYNTINKVWLLEGWLPTDFFHFFVKNVVI
jgi:hypothetical protein